MNIFLKRRRFEALYQEHKDEVFTFIYYRCGRDQMVAEDIASDVFLRAFDRFELYDETYSFRQWIFTMTRHRIIDYYRKKKDLVPGDEALSDIADDDRHFYEVLDQSYDLKHIERMLKTLSPKQRQCIEARYFTGDSVSEIAKKKSMSTDAVEKNISRGLAALRAKFSHTI